MSIRITTSDLKSKVDELNNRYGTNFKLNCYRPGSQTLCQLNLVVGDGYMDVTPYMTPRELNQVLDTLTRLRLYKDKGWLKGNLF